MLFYAQKYAEAESNANELVYLHCRGVNSINDEVKNTQKPRATQMNLFICTAEA